jgi:alginate O-acetyltransferase complex protein AlgJ
MTSKCHSEPFIQSVSFVAFITLFSLFSLISCFSPHPTVSVQENRALAQFPKIHTASKDLAKFPSGFEQFYNDRFPLRLSLISAKNFLAYKLFNSSANPLVNVGQHDWLFYNSYGMLPAQLNTQPFTERELQSWVSDLQARKAFCDQHGIKFVLVIAPEKGTMYPEYLPAGWKRLPGTSRLEQLQSYLREHTDIDFVDAKSFLAAEKQHGHKIYHSNDTHWNQRSAFLVSQEILAHLHKVLPAVTPVPKTDLLDGHDKFTGDLAKMLGLQTVLPDESPSIVERTPPKSMPDNSHLASMGSDQPAFAARRPNSSLPKALVLRDSFFTYLTAPLSEHFGYTEFQWTNNFQAEQILGVHPDVLINEIAERHLYEEFHEHVPQFVTASTPSDITTKPICSFGDKFDLVGMTSEKTYKGAVLKLTWRSKQPVNLDYLVGLQCLNTQNKLTGGANYEPDILHREVAANSEWVDTVYLADRELNDATTLGVLVYQKGKPELTCSIPGTTWDKRYEVSLSDLKHDSSTTERIAEGGSTTRL